MSALVRENVMASVVTQQREPDGRPLYAYKWHDEYYERLKATVREQMPGALRGKRIAVLPPCFACMQRKPFAVGMQEGHGPGRPCLMRLDLHPIIRLYPPG